MTDLRSTDRRTRDPRTDDQRTDAPSGGAPDASGSRAGPQSAHDPGKSGGSADRFADEESVRGALRALAHGTAPTEAPPLPYRRIVDEAAASLDCVDEAASVLGDDPRRLRRAVSIASDRGDEATAERGRRALADLARYRRAAAGTDAASAADGTTVVTDPDP